MDKHMIERILYWTPRVLMILFAVFISIFAADVFGEYQGFELVIALFMHLIPTFVAIAAVIVAWKWERVGGAIILALGIFSIFFFNNDDAIAILLVSGPPILVGALFLAHHYFAKKS